jgi:oxalate decarboxylase/phosphoglucose isomerase-like protein (cupin superfamily)
MNFSMNKWLSKILLSICLLSCTSFITAATDEHGFVIVQADQFDWGPDLTKVKTVVLQGDPSAPGFYIIRIRFPAGMTSRPHFHNQDRFVTVIQGTWYAGTQATYDMSKTVPIKAGGFMKHPAGAIHFDGAKDEAVIVEIRGMGPVTTTSAEQRAN